MVEDELTDGRRIGQLLSSEIHGHERGGLGRLSIVDADREVEPTEDGAFAYGIDLEADGETIRIADVYLSPDRIRVSFRTAVGRAADLAKSEGLRCRPKAVDPPQTLVFIENGAEVKPGLRVVRGVAESLLEA